VPPMTKLSSALATAFIIALFPTISPSEAQAVGEGVHPWDTYNRTYRASSKTRRSNRAHQNNPYYQRTQTHALHPYYRNNYHVFLNTSTSRKTNFQQQLFLSGFPYYRIPDVADCRNHSYFRANYRTPPSDFRCIRH
jgi:hypothetical protein